MYAITGIGILDSLGENLQSNYEKLLNRDYGTSYSIDKVEGHPKVDPTVHMALKTSSQAVEQSGWNTNEYTDVAVISSGIFSGGHNFVRSLEAHKDGKRASIKQLLTTGQNFISTNISEQNKFIGPSFFITSSCTAGLSALEVGIMHIDRGYDKVLVNSVDAMSEVWMNGWNKWYFNSIGAWTSDGNVKPFDIDRTGIKIGDASVSMALEPLDKAIERNASILAVIEQVESAVDSDHPTQPSKEARGTKTMMDKIKNMSVDYVNAHATGTPVGDIVEYSNMQRYYPEGTPMTSFKGAIGHCMGASGLVELAYTVETMNRNVIAPSPYLDKPLGRYFDFVIDEPLEKPINRAMKNSFGFGGRCATVVLRKDKDV